MKKRLSAIVLALVLCLGLTVPALAAVTQPPVASFDLPDGVTVSEKTAAFQIRHITSEYPEDGGAVHTYDEQPTSEEVTYTALPLAAMITIEHMRPGDDLSYYTTIHAYSDPDDDGIYEERLFFYDADKNFFYDPENYSIVPLTEKGPFTQSKLAGFTSYSSGVSASVTPVTGFTEEINGALTADTDELCRLWGPNTLIRVSMQLQLRGKLVGYSPDDFWFLITGEGSPRTEPPAKPYPTFTDVPVWCAEAVLWAVNEDITKGKGNNKFAPDDDCTTAQILTFLWRAKDEPGSSATEFSGVRDYGPALNWAYENDMIGPRADPNASCTRDIAIWYIWMAQGMPPATQTSSFSDVDYSAPYAEAVNWAVENGIVEGYGNGIFRPGRVCNRGVIVTMLQRAYVPETRLNAK